MSGITDNNFSDQIWGFNFEDMYGYAYILKYFL